MELYEIPFDKNGKAMRYASTTKPEDIAKDIVKIL